MVRSVEDVVIDPKLSLAGKPSFVVVEQARNLGRDFDVPPRWAGDSDPNLPVHLRTKHQ